MIRKFIKSAEKYSLMIDWDSRLAREIPFLQEQLNCRGLDSGNLLDVGGGPCRHAAAMEKKGYSVSVADKKFDTAYCGSANIELIEGDFLEGKIFSRRKFDAVYSLGNTAALLASQSSYRKVIKRFFDLLKPGGVVVFQTLNFEKERNSWSEPRSAVTENGEYVFLRSFSTSSKFMHPFFITLFKAAGERKWEMETAGPADIPRISSKQVIKIMKKTGLIDIKLFGSYQMDPFKSSRSVDMVWSAVKKKS